MFSYPLHVPRDGLHPAGVQQGEYRTIIRRVFHSADPKPPPAAAAAVAALLCLSPSPCDNQNNHHNNKLLSTTTDHDLAQLLLNSPALVSTNTAPPTDDTGAVTIAQLTAQRQPTTPQLVNNLMVPPPSSGSIPSISRPQPPPPPSPRTARIFVPRARRRNTTPPLNYGRSTEEKLCDPIRHEQYQDVLKLLVSKTSWLYQQEQQQQSKTPVKVFEKKEAPDKLPRMPHTHRPPIKEKEEQSAVRISNSAQLDDRNCPDQKIANGVDLETQPLTVMAVLGGHLKKKEASPQQVDTPQQHPNQQQTSSSSTMINMMDVTRPTTFNLNGPVVPHREEKEVGLDSDPIERRSPPSDAQDGRYPSSSSLHHASSTSSQKKKFPLSSSSTTALESNAAGGIPTSPNLPGRGGGGMGTEIRLLVAPVVSSLSLSPQVLCHEDLQQQQQQQQQQQPQSSYLFSTNNSMAAPSSTGGPPPCGPSSPSSSTTATNFRNFRGRQLSTGQSLELTSWMEDMYQYDRNAFSSIGGGGGGVQPQKKVVVTQTTRHPSEQRLEQVKASSSSASTTSVVPPQHFNTSMESTAWCLDRLKGNRLSVEKKKSLEVQRPPTSKDNDNRPHAAATTGGHHCPSPRTTSTTTTTTTSEKLVVHFSPKAYHYPERPNNSSRRLIVGMGTDKGSSSAAFSEVDAFFNQSLT